ncbi:MAG TPA: hypothetical protein VLF61_00170, partial [Rhabdochlamydiaceae bacterium]|nr:hypothetical protein [Rhabdochlamydiaceae bacterium]
MEQQEIILDLPKEHEEKAVVSLSFSDFLKMMEMQKDPEEKIRNCIAFMQQCLSREGPPSFKEFWEARKLSLLLFKESLNPKVRNELWECYVGLTTEAYHLKEMMDNESSFARQQIESAIQDLEKNLHHFAVLAQQVPSLELPEECRQAAAQSGSYNRHNQELHLLHSYAERIHSLRKEVLKTQMRFRFKNKLLDQLMKLGDQVFPRRKELTQQLSQLFLNDVESYVDCSFPKEIQDSPAIVKDTIKAFQFVAKQLYLSAEVVSKSKELLSQCWQKVQVRQQEQKEVGRTQYEQLSKKVLELEAAFSEGKLQEEALDAAYAQLQQEMSKLDLGREESRAIK